MKVKISKLMTDKEAKVIEYQKKYEEAKLFLQEKYNRKFTDLFLSSLLCHYYNTDDVHLYLIFHDKTKSIDLKEVIDKEYKSVIGSIDYYSSDFECLISDKIEKAKVKNKGLIWTIHNNDKDPKPSKPHAHEYTLNIKLHLGTGEYYKNNKYIGKLSKKEFLRLRQKIEDKGIIIPKFI